MFHKENLNDSSECSGTGVISPVWCPQTDKNSHCRWWHQWGSPRHLGGTHHRCLHQHHSRHKIVQLWNILHTICNKCQLEWFDCYKGEYSECQKDPGHNAVPLTCMTLANHRVAVLHCTHSTKWYLNWPMLTTAVLCEIVQNVCRLRLKLFKLGAWDTSSNLLGVLQELSWGRG